MTAPTPQNTPGLCIRIFFFYDTFPFLCSMWSQYSAVLFSITSPIQEPTRQSAPSATSCLQAGTERSLTALRTTLRDKKWGRGWLCTVTLSLIASSWCLLHYNKVVFTKPWKVHPACWAIKKTVSIIISHTFSKYLFLVLYKSRRSPNFHHSIPLN